MRIASLAGFLSIGCLATGGGAAGDDDDSVLGDGVTEDDDPIAGDSGDADTDGDSDGGGEPEPEPDGGDVDPPLGGSSGGAGGGAASGEARRTAGGVEYRIVVPAGAGGPLGLLLVFSGTEGGAQMTENLRNLAPMTGLQDLLLAVIDGAVYYGDSAAGASVLDEARADYDVDNDRTYLMSESAGTSAGLGLGFRLRQSYFAAFWANDVNASDAPALHADALGFAPWGNAGPGGDFPDAAVIVGGMSDAGYRIEEPAPYDGPGAGDHGDPDQFVAALEWFGGRSRR